MVTTEPSTKSQFSPMAKSTYRNKSSSVFNDGFLYLGGALLAFLLVWSFWSYAGPTITNTFQPNIGASNSRVQDEPAVNLRFDPPDRTFYDDPELSYSIEKPIKNWDEKRKEWLKLHPSFAAGARDRVVMVTGSQSKPCKNPIGDHFLLRFFKNKVDYCRIHGYDIFYNNVLLHPKMPSFWAKYPVVKAAMLAHPEAEWIWWVDSDAMFTDMEYKLPLRRYDFKNHNLVVHGWEKLIYGAKSWTSLNAGVFLIRNCQWSMDFMDKWANMGPMSSDFKKWGKIQRSLFKDKLFPESDDQSALIYMIYKDKELMDKIYLEGEYYFEGYWFDIVSTYDNITDKYTEIERGDPKLRRRHAEKVSEQYGAFREKHLKAAGNGKGSWRRPFITHFTGCQPCSGDHNKMYEGDSCWNGMVKALNFADNQVLRKYGFVHPDLLDTNTVEETPFDYPDEGPW
ncbi:putative glycosyltransferase 7 [Euphorbia lathyris]|uniref:putative glycosyltransferase 7 n=1 Tax=Euphorbia lathyris TaxID=212925 RepID=UPI003313C976